MSQEELLQLAKKIKGNMATDEEREQFFGGLNSILDEMISAVGETKNGQL